MGWKTNHRLRIECEDQYAPPTAGIYEEIDEQAQLWYIAKNTVVGTNSLGDLKKTKENFVTRNDRELLIQKMAAIAARRMSRLRAHVQVKGICQAAECLGRIATTFQDGNSVYLINGPVTQVSWNFGQGGATTINIGYGS